MANNKATVYYARNLNDVMFHLKTLPQLAIYGGCTTVNKFMPSSLILRNIPDFQQIDKHEHFIEYGAAVTLSEILELGKKKQPSFFYDAVATIANPFVRNNATIGGNICIKGIKHTLFAPLLAADAQLEIHSSNDVTFIPISKFTSVPDLCFLSRIRIPTNEYEISLFNRIGPVSQIDETSASFTFLANTQKSILSDLRIAFGGVFALRSRELENKLIGTRLPINIKTIEKMEEEASKLFDTQVAYLNITYNPMVKASFLNFLHNALSQLM